MLSDGSGFVSKEVMKEVARRLGMVDQATPSAIQARFGGAKGVWLRCDDPSEWPCLRNLRSKLTAGASNDDSVNAAADDDDSSGGSSGDSSSNGGGSSDGGSGGSGNDNGCSSSGCDNGRWIVIRKSQRKYEPPPLERWDAHQRTLDVCFVSRASGSTTINKV